MEIERRADGLQAELGRVHEACTKRPSTGSTATRRAGKPQRVQLGRAPLGPSGKVDDAQRPQPAGRAGAALRGGFVQRGALRVLEPDAHLLASADAMRAGRGRAVQGL